jgi:hypothetical protein
LDFLISFGLEFRNQKIASEGKLCVMSLSLDYALCLLSDLLASNKQTARALKWGKICSAATWACQ